MPTNANRKEDRVLLLAPTRRDGEVTSGLLSSAGLSCAVCRDLNGLTDEIVAGAGAVLLTEEALTAAGIAQLLAVIQAQPSWSQLPIVLLMRGGAQSTVAASVLQALGNVMLLERPAPMRTVVSALVAAVRARQRQYQIRDQLEEIHRAEVRSRDLQQQLARLLASERAARAEAERVSQMKDEFLATLSHELRTPLNAIYGWTQILKMGVVDSQTIEEGIAVIDRNVRAQTQLIEDLLDMNRIASGKVRLDVQPVDLADVLQAALETVRPAIEAKQLRLDTIIDPTARLVSGDPGRLQQVFWNLLTNAIKFTPPGGSIQVVTQRVDAHTEISISDSGEGISPEFLPRLFDRFSQAVLANDAFAKQAEIAILQGVALVPAQPCSGRPNGRRAYTARVHPLRALSEKDILSTRLVSRKDVLSRSERRRSDTVIPWRPATMREFPFARAGDWRPAGRRC